MIYVRKFGECNNLNIEAAELFDLATTYPFSGSPLSLVRNRLPLLGVFRFPHLHHQLVHFIGVWFAQKISETEL